LAQGGWGIEWLRWRIEDQRVGQDVRAGYDVGLDDE